MVNFDFLKNISIGQSDLIKSFAVFYLIIFSNTVLGLFTCEQINFIKKNKHVLIFIAFFLFYFLVTLASNSKNREFIPPIQKLIYTVIYFIIFLITTRLDFRVMFAVLALIFIIYFIEINKDYYLELGKTIHDKKEKTIYDQYTKFWVTLDYPYKIRLFPVSSEDFIIINKIEYVLYSLIYILLILGFISYRGEIKDTLGKNKDISWVEVFTDTEICKLNEKKPFWHYLKIGFKI
jgi:hypothetical protein